jgi:hypothetical protein
MVLVDCYWFGRSYAHLSKVQPENKRTMGRGAQDVIWTWKTVWDMGKRVYRFLDAITTAVQSTYTHRTPVRNPRWDALSKGSCCTGAPRQIDLTCMTRSWARSSLCVKLTRKGENRFLWYTNLGGCARSVRGFWAIRLSLERECRGGGTWQMSAWAPS